MLILKSQLVNIINMTMRMQAIKMQLQSEMSPLMYHSGGVMTTQLNQLNGKQGVPQLPIAVISNASLSRKSVLSLKPVLEGIANYICSISHISTHDLEIAYHDLTAILKTIYHTYSALILYDVDPVIAFSVWQSFHKLIPIACIEKFEASMLLEILYKIKAEPHICILGDYPVSAWLPPSLFVPAGIANLIIVSENSQIMPPPSISSVLYLAPHYPTISSPQAYILKQRLSHISLSIAVNYVVRNKLNMPKIKIQECGTNCHDIFLLYN